MQPQSPVSTPLKMHQLTDKLHDHLIDSAISKEAALWGFSAKVRDKSKVISRYLLQVDPSDIHLRWEDVSATAIADMLLWLVHHDLAKRAKNASLFPFSLEHFVNCYYKGLNQICRSVHTAEACEAAQLERLMTQVAKYSHVVKRSEDPNYVYVKTPRTFQLRSIASLEKARLFDRTGNEVSVQQVRAQDDGPYFVFEPLDLHHCHHAKTLQDLEKRECVSEQFVYSGLNRAARLIEFALKRQMRALGKPLLHPVNVRDYLEYTIHSATSRLGATEEMREAIRSKLGLTGGVIHVNLTNVHLGETVETKEGPRFKSSMYDRINCFYMDMSLFVHRPYKHIAHGLKKLGVREKILEEQTFAGGFPTGYKSATQQEKAWGFSEEECKAYIPTDPDTGRPDKRRMPAPAPRDEELLPDHLPRALIIKKRRVK